MRTLVGGVSNIVSSKVNSHRKLLAKFCVNNVFVRGYIFGWGTPRSNQVALMMVVKYAAFYVVGN